jgi:hypothetical protein
MTGAGGGGSYLFPARTSPMGIYWNKRKLISTIFRKKRLGFIGVPSPVIPQSPDFTKSINQKAKPLLPSDGIISIKRFSLFKVK